VRETRGRGGEVGGNEPTRSKPGGMGGNERKAGGRFASSTPSGKSWRKQSRCGKRERNPGESEEWGGIFTKNPEE
jgi:hypothetical protein